MTATAGLVFSQGYIHVWTIWLCYNVDDDDDDDDYDDDGGDEDDDFDDDDEEEDDDDDDGDDDGDDDVPELHVLLLPNLWLSGQSTSVYIPLWEGCHSTQIGSSPITLEHLNKWIEPATLVWGSQMYKAQG